MYSHFNSFVLFLVSVVKIEFLHFRPKRWAQLTDWCWATFYLFKLKRKSDTLRQLCSFSAVGDTSNLSDQQNNVYIFSHSIQFFCAVGRNSIPFPPNSYRLSTENKLRSSPENDWLKGGATKAAWLFETRGVRYCNFWQGQNGALFLSKC